MQETERRFSFAVEGAGDGIWDWDIKTNEMSFSPLYAQMLGFETNELPKNITSWKNHIAAKSILME